MKFSVALPTRNRLEYLKYAIASVLRQDYADWEIIVSDNASEEDVQGYIASLSDRRIHYYRTKDFCSVTDNWNNALEKCTGEYVIMLGDDDALLPGYFSTSLKLLQQHNLPDLMYTSALIYVYPNVQKDRPNGSLVQHGYAPFLVETESPCILNKEIALNCVEKSLNFIVEINYNSQHSLIHRSLITKLKQKGSFYQSPYPDYYSTVALFLTAERILAVPYPMVVIGVSPKSFGYFYSNNKEKEGTQFLHNLQENEAYRVVSKWQLTGTLMNTSWLFAMETVRKNFQECALKVNYRKYRLLQIAHSLRLLFQNEKIELKILRQLIKGLFWWEKIVFTVPLFLVLLLDKQYMKTTSHRLAYKYSHPCHGAPKEFQGEYKNIIEVFENFGNHEGTNHRNIAYV